MVQISKKQKRRFLESEWHDNAQSAAKMFLGEFDDVLKHFDSFKKKADKQLYAESLQLSSIDMLSSANELREDIIEQLLLGGVPELEKKLAEAGKTKDNTDIYIYIYIYIYINILMYNIG